MTWIVEQKRTWPEWAAIRMLRVGPVPNHLAVIMDGNRRFARKEHKDTLAGHTQGFHKLAEVLCWCRDLGINEVTAYAFSIENFKRSKQEVDGLMELAAEKFAKLLEEKEKLAKHGVCIRVIGDLNLLPQRIRKLAGEAILASRHNNKCFLNLALAYTSREEISFAMSELSQAVHEEQLMTSDISEELLEKCLHTRGSRDPDLLVRTSGEVRLSDFLLWQSAFSCLFFTKVLWPEFTIWHLFGAVFYYQRHYHTLTAARQECLALRQCSVEESDIECCYTKFGDKVSQEHIAAYASARKERIENFLATLHNKKLNYLHQISEEGD
ncbi:dehydrodolichyl diphosphate synthase complex subunit DHDDS [Procambarus clarkii]|uniref:dehydrodolichyl diphosphate synthase complex subunit DHDDS n=1 Tax=Procambarus clarkii TaxID=6728 RepID=UPI001E670A67|nr:dehydrodolichyl diphosphate synthase complex subunit DHDDS-like [Procambarus clarkii]XP_045621337.1 dehydrodolichyl diphosphate synthase complex subunit DHDDS-like [Procambarus clarkii]XP_045621345.1 dehydrodolichyl diphosphate synthase complex subunit DHDDS-like [Procambarus clarkii]XP_045621353.1 dehydrodolichyl diphosphate synthase complex subunit DHDDS-like [Procambarus clarkii]